MRAAQRIAYWRHNPVAFVREQFGVEPDAWQVDVLEAFADPSQQRHAMQACAGPGKSAVLAWCGWHFLACQGEAGHHPVGAATSISGDNLRDNLWKELAVWRSRSAFLTAAFEWTQTRIFAKDHPETWFLSARTYSQSADTEKQGRTLSGLHGKYILYLIDESGDIAPSVLRAAEQGLSNCAWGKILQAGNPTSHDGVLYQSVTNEAHLWHVTRVTGDPENAKRSSRISLEWAREKIRQYGRENPWVMAYILGLFPPSSLNQLLGPDEVRAAMTRHHTPDRYDWSQKRLGIDVARFGDDRTVLYPRQGLAAFKPVEMRSANTSQIAGRVMAAKARWGSELEFIDSTGGYGAGVEDQCLAAGNPLIAVHFSGKPDDPRYFNKRSEMHFRAAEWVKAGGAFADAPEDIVREATAPIYWLEKGKLRVEEKEQIKKRIGVSPDYWDAFITTFAFAEMPANAGAYAVHGTGDSGMYHALTEYEPFSA